MKKIYLVIPILLLFSCIDDDSSFTKTISKGDIWGIKIGSSHSDVYAQLQEMSNEKNINQVAVVYRQPFSKPEEIQNHLNFYNAITLQNASTVYSDRVIFEFREDKINFISAGGALPTEITQWPQNVPDKTAIHKNDSVDDIYDKLLAIYEIPTYSNYQIILPDKTLSKPFDPDMTNYQEWAFSFSTDVKPGLSGNSHVRLFFKNDQLDKIQHQYRENEVVN